MLNTELSADFSESKHWRVFKSEHSGQNQSTSWHAETSVCFSNWIWENIFQSTLRFRNNIKLSYLNKSAEVQGRHVGLRKRLTQAACRLKKKSLLWSRGGRVAKEKWKKKSSSWALACLLGEPSPPSASVPKFPSKPGPRNCKQKTGSRKERRASQT